MISLEPLKASDWETVSKIYEDGLDVGTFEESIPSWEDFNVKHHEFSRFTARIEGDIVGWASIQPVSTREVYKGVAEVSVYVDKTKRGLGIGKALLNMVIHESEKHGIWTLVSVILKINKVSINLHQSLGFRIVGTREKIGKKRGEWMDTILMERRSNIVGIE